MNVEHITLTRKAFNRWLNKKYDEYPNRQEDNDKDWMGLQAESKIPDKDFRIGLWQYDGCDLYWMDDGEQSSLELTFDKLEDAAYAMACWDNFVKGKTGREPKVRTKPNGDVEVL